MISQNPNATPIWLLIIFSAISYFGIPRIKKFVGKITPLACADYKTLLIHSEQIKTNNDEDYHINHIVGDSNNSCFCTGTGRYGMSAYGRYFGMYDRQLLTYSLYDNGKVLLRSYINDGDYLNGEIGLAANWKLLLLPSLL